MNNNDAVEKIRYTGTITVTMKRGHKVVSKHTYHNAGNTPLFEFLCNCIISSKFPNAKAPRYVKLFTFANEPATSTAITAASEPITASVYYNAGTVTDTDSNPAAYLHFTIPCSAIDYIDGQTQKKIYQAGLYNAANTKDTSKTNYCASFNFLDDNGA